MPELLNSLSLNLEFLRRMVADLDDDQMVGQVGGVVNHPAWTVGHIAYSFELMGSEVGMSSWLPEDWAGQGPSSIPVGNKQRTPPGC